MVVPRLQVNAAAPQKDMGSVNGASQAGASFVRAVGPALGGIVWGLSVAIPFTGHQVSQWLWEILQGFRILTFTNLLLATLNSGNYQTKKQIAFVPS